MSPNNKEKKWKSNPFFYLHDLKFYRIILKNFILTLIVVIIPIMTLVFIIFLLIINNSRNSIILNSKNDLVKLSSEMDANWTSQKTTCLQASLNTYVQNYIKSADINLNYDNLDTIKHIQDYISLIMSSNPLIDKVMFYFDDKKYLITMNSAWGILDSSLDNEYYSYHAIPTEIIQEFYKESIVSTIIKSDQGVYFYRNILSNGKLKAAVLIRNDYYYVYKWLLKKLPDPKSSVMILNDQLEILVDSSNTPQYRSLLPKIQNMASEGISNDITNINGHQYAVTLQKSGSSDWIYILIFPAMEYEKNLGNIISIMALLLIAVFAASLILSWYISLKFYRPIQVIHHLLQHPGEGVSYEADYANVDELGLISTLIQQSHFQKLMITDELKSKKELLKKAQNVALQAQINPHFIFNTLECINWKILSHFKMENEITTMLSNFSRLMRLVLQNGNNFVTLRTETDHARIYLKIREAQSPNTFTVEWNLDDSLLDYTMPSLLLQPIVENSFAHGIRKLDSSISGVISISCKDGGDRLIIEVCDNGPGIDEQTMDTIHTQLTSSMMAENKHIGLSNVHQRIQLTFGEEWGLSIDSLQNHGTKVNINIPKVKYLALVDIHQ